MSESPVYRLPITINGYIEFEDGCARGVIDINDWDYSPLHKVSAYGEDPEVVEIDVDGKVVVEADTNIVTGIRKAIPTEIAWETT
jgi:hypothetical protein